MINPENSMEDLIALFESYTGKKVVNTKELTSSGSNRRYYRMESAGISLIGVVGTSREENHAFITIARHFYSQGLNVPQVYAVSEDEMTYIQEDLGDLQLYQMVSAGREAGDYNEEEVALLCKAVSKLPEIQFMGAAGMDFGVCYPDSEFNERMVNFDLNYFKYDFLKLTGLEFNEIKLQDDFDRLREDSLDFEGETFMYRDFQARNIMMKDGEPHFIDFQGGRRGPIQYDLASFLWNAGTHFSPKMRRELELVYLDSLKEFRSVSEEEFYEKYRLITLVRLLQEMGAYGFRGLVERKQLFIDCIPTALGCISELAAEPFARYPYLTEVLRRLAGEWDGSTILPGMKVTL